MRKLLIMLLCCLVLAGCGNQGDNQEPAASETVQAVAEQETNENISESQSYAESKAVGSDAYQKGQELGEQLNEKLESIDWEENYEKAEDAGKEAAEWLNKLFE